jgi:hypothetical protein
MEDLTTDHWPPKKNIDKFSLDAYALSYKYGTCFAYNVHVNDVNVCTFKPKLSFYDYSMLFLAITNELYETL